MGFERGTSYATLFLLALVASPGHAQTGTGNIQGTVKDLTGAVVPGAKVTISQSRTGLTTSTTTNEVGFYLFPSVQLGPYEITVEAAGMERWKGALTLMAGQSAEVNPTLKVGSTATEITVAGNVTPLITTNSPTLSNIVERARIEQLPLNGRFITTLVYMTTPGLESGSVPRVYGLRYASEMLQDGAVLENRDWQSIPARPPGLDTVEEFRAETNNSSARMNRPGTIILTTRAGTNRVHGAVFWTTRNSGVGVARARQDYYLKPPHLVRNEFGASLGGPVFLPRIYNGENKTFFFSAYEGYRYRAASTRSITMPTLAMRQGDFSGLVNAQGRRFTLYDPMTTDSRTWQRQPFSNNQIPMARQSPLAKYLYGITPAPTHPDNPLVTANWFGPGFDKTNQHTETVRVDHRLSVNDQLFFRYSHNPAFRAYTYDPISGTSPTTLDMKANAAIDEGQNDNAVANWTHTFSPTFFSETLFTLSRDYRGQIPYTRDEEIASKLGLPNPFNFPGFPRLTGTGFGMVYDSSINTNINYAWIVNADQNFTKVMGRHELQFGLRMRYERLDTLPDQQEQYGSHTFSSLATALYDPASGSAYSSAPFTGHDSANLFLGMATYRVRFNRQWFRMRADERAGYFQDNFRVNSRLTLNAGVRYEYNSPVKEANDSLISFNPRTHAAVMTRTVDEMAKLGVLVPSIAKAWADLGLKYETPEQAGLPKALVHPNWWDVGPRAGFAYRFGSLNRPTVLRGGYSIFAYPESLRLYNGYMEWTVPSTGYLAYNPNSAELSPDGLPNYLLRSVPTIIAGVNSANVIDVNKATGIARGGATMYYFDPHQPTARAHEWNLMLERELVADTSIKIGYVGTHGARMSQWYSYNESPPAYVWYTTTGLPYPTGPYANVARRNFDQQVYGSIRAYQKTGWSNNSSFQIEVQHRYSKGYAFQAFYVMSNAMRVAGDGWRDDQLPAINMFLPGIVPADNNARNRLLFYRRDTGIPKHRVNWNWIVDLPFGKGKPLGRDAGGLLNALIGGWQIAGNGALTSRYFQLPASNWGPAGKVEVYGKKYPIQDCRSGVCYDGWLYWNGYIPANRINSYAANGRPNGVMGVPDSFQPFRKPLIPTPKDGGSPSDPMYPYYESNTAWVPLKDGTLQRTSFDTGLHPLINQYVLGPMIWNMHASAFKSVRLREQMFVRFNVDFFSVFNMPGTTMPGGDGVILNRSSANSPRVLQLTLRLSW
ncbi:MAG: TonB-dependent receptor [Acidobacteriota bacterium]